MRIPAKYSFSMRYSKDGICGALGSLDQGASEGSDIARTGVTRVISVQGGEMNGRSEAMGEGLRVRWRNEVRQRVITI